METLSLHLLGVPRVHPCVGSKGPCGPRQPEVTPTARSDHPVLCGKEQQPWGLSPLRPLLSCRQAPL